MKHMKSLFYISVITSLLILMFLGTLYGASVTMQREGALQNQNDQEIRVSKNNMNMAGNQLKLAPQRLKNKSDSGMGSESGIQSGGMEQYKPYKDGEGERKIK